MAIGIEDRVKISPASWPSKANTPPGDLRQYAPAGLGLSAPLVMRPWDTLEETLGRGNAYGSTGRTGDPIRDAPVNDATGGVIYFDGNVERPQLAAVLSLLEVRDALTGYAVFAAESTDPPNDRYLAQIRIVDFGAMHLFGAVPDVDDRPWEQPLDVGSLIEAFIAAQLQRWGDGMSAALAGTLNGDGDWAQEKLAFGFMVENAYNGIYRLWSRPWLVTK
jgi:hypothetical protein